MPSTLGILGAHADTPSWSETSLRRTFRPVHIIAHRSCRRLGTARCCNRLKLSCKLQAEHPDHGLGLEPVAYCTTDSGKTPYALHGGRLAGSLGGELGKRMISQGKTDQYPNEPSQNHFLELGTRPAGNTSSFRDAGHLANHIVDPLAWHSRHSLLPKQPVETCN